MKWSRVLVTFAVLSVVIAVVAAHFAIFEQSEVAAQIGTLWGVIAMLSFVAAGFASDVENER